jgi:sigma-E factor negative regulatory protein RseC
MIEEEAVVVGMNGELVEVDIIRTKPCGLCGKVQGCGNSIWSKIFPFQKKKIQIQNKINAKVGEKVKLVIEENYLLKASLLLYGVPLLSLFGGMISFEYFVHGGNDLVTLFGGIVGLSLGIVILRLITVQNHNKLFREAVLAKID